MIDLHYLQIKILQDLAFIQKQSFSDIHKKLSEITSDHLSYHLRKLIKSKIIAKNDLGEYYLTLTGKEQVAKMNVEDDNPSIVRQGIHSVAVFAFEGDNYNSRLLLHKRLKQPFKGYSGGITCKIKRGEFASDVARRILKEKSGLEGDVFMHGVAHFLIYNGELLVSDKYFHIFSALSSKGNLIKTNKLYENEFVDLNNIPKSTMLFENLIDMLDMFMKNPNQTYLEKAYSTDGY